MIASIPFHIRCSIAATILITFYIKSSIAATISITFYTTLRCSLPTSLHHDLPSFLSKEVRIAKSYPWILIQPHFPAIITNRFKAVYEHLCNFPHRGEGRVISKSLALSPEKNKTITSMQRLITDNSKKATFKLLPPPPFVL